MKKVIAIDFDGTIAETIVEDGVPMSIKNEIEDAVEAVRKLYSCARYELILYTCRGNQYLNEAINWLAMKGILSCFSEINEQPKIWREHTVWGKIYSRKIYADIYIDDKNFGGFPGWQTILNELL